MWAVVTLNYSSTVLDFTNDSSDVSRSLIPKAVIFLCSMIILFSPYVLPLCSVVAFVFGRIIPKEIQSSIIRIQNFTPKEYFRLYSSREFQVTINCLKKGNHRQFFTLYNLQKNNNGLLLIKLWIFAHCNANKITTGGHYDILKTELKSTQPTRKNSNQNQWLFLYFSKDIMRLRLWKCLEFSKIFSFFPRTHQYTA